MLARLDSFTPSNSGAISAALSAGGCCPRYQPARDAAPVAIAVSVDAADFGLKFILRQARRALAAAAISRQ